MRDAIAMQSYQWLAAATITPVHISVKSNLARIASRMCRILCEAARISRMMIVPRAPVFGPDLDERRGISPFRAASAPLRGRQVGHTGCR
jgi:hypothetical protein